MKSPRSHFASRYSVAFILCLTSLMILMASALSVSPNSSTASLTPSSSPSSSPSGARVSATATSAAAPTTRSVASPPPLSPFAAGLTATKTDNTSSPVDPGATIMYTVVINSNGTTDATNVIFTDTIDSNTTLQGVVASSPVAFDDTYTASGNIPIAPATNLLANDIDPDTGTNAGLNVTQVQGAAGNVGNPTNTTATGIGGVNGSVTVLANGTFTYQPPPGFTGDDTFTYQISDASLKTGSGTVKITISNMVWFIDNSSVAANSRGTFTEPFKTIAAFNAVNSGAAPNPQNGHHVVVRPASGGYAETDGINLRDSQTLTGPAVAFNTVFTANANSTSAYNTFAAGTGTAVAITATAGNGVDLGSGNALRGFNIGNTSGFGFNGTVVGSLTVATVSKTGTGGAMSVSTSGAFGSVVNFGTFESTSSATNNLNLVGVTGTLGVGSAGAGFAGSAANNAAINISGGSVSFTYAGNVSKATNGTLLNGGLLSVSNMHTGTLIFNTGTLNASSGTGLQFDNADGTYNFNGTTTLVGGDAGVDILNNSTGVFTFSSSTNITNPSGTAFNVNSSSPGVTYSGNISQSIAAQRVINIDTTASNTITFQTGTITGGASSTGININAANGNVTFSNGMTLGTTGTRLTSQALTITGGTGTYNLGVASIFTSNQNGIVATSADGTINCSAATVVDTGTATAININGPVGLTSLGMAVTSLTSSGGTATGLIIQNTNGSFTVNGDGVNTTKGGNGTGGTLANKDDGGTDGSGTVGTSIFLNNVTNITLRRMQMNDDKNFGIRGTSVTGFTLQYSSVNGANGDNDAQDEDSIRFINLLGSATVDNCIISGGWEDTFFVQNNTGTLDRLSVTNCTIGLNSVNFGNDGIHFETVTNAGNTMKLTVDTTIFTGARGDLIDTIAQIGTTMSVIFTNNTGTNTHTNSVGGGTIFHGGGTVTLNIANNNLSGSVGGTEINVSKNATAGTYNGTIANNITGTNSNTKSGGNNGIFVDGGGAGSMTMSVTGNTLKDYGNVGIYFIANNQTVSGNNGSLNATVTGNTTTGFSGAGSQVLAGIFCDIGSGLNNDTTSACVDIGGAGALANDFSAGDPANAMDVDLSVQDNCTFRLPSYGGPPIAGNTVSTYIKGRNTNSAGTTVSVSTGVTHGYTGGAACTAPSMGALSAHPGEFATQSAAPVSDQSNPSGDQDAILRTTQGEAPYDERVQKLRQEDLNWMVQAAINRWVETGVSTEDFSRLQAVTFEVADLPNSELASINGTHVKIDETGAGYGWFYDQSPLEDGEFQIEVPGKELHTTQFSPARGKVDLLTVLMRELGQVYLQGKDRLPKIQRKNLAPMMEPTLSPGVRRLPLNQFKVTPPTTGSIKPAAAATQASADVSTEPLGTSADTTAGLADSVSVPAGVNYAVFNPATDRARPRPTPAMMTIKNGSGANSPAQNRARRVGSASPFSGETVTVNGSGSGFTIPVGKSVTIMFSVTVNAANTFPPGTTQVCNQGFVSATGIASFGTTDPGPPVVNGPTCTQLNVADVSVTKSAGAPTTCSTSNIVYTIGYNNAGPASALAVVVSDPMPAGTSLVSAPAPANWTRTDSVPVGGNGTLMFSRTGPSPTPDPATFTVTVSIDGSVTDGTVLSNTASVTSTTPDPNTANNTSSPVTMVTVKTPPAPSNAGPDQAVCALVATLAGNTPSIGTGMWSQFSGPGTTTFSDASSPSSMATVTVAGAYTFRWTITNGPCISTDDVVITYTAAPTTSNAGPDQPNVCGLVATLAGNTPATGTGMWSQFSGPGTTTFSNASSPTSTATVTVVGAYTFRWTITNGTCTSTDDVVVTYTATPTTSNAGPDQPNVCGLVATLAGNTPATGTGMWSQFSGPGTTTFSNAASPTSTATVTVQGAYTFRWTITNGPCTSTDDVIVTYTAQPTTSNAGTDQPNVCGLVATLAGNPALVGSGMWSQVSGPGTTTFSNAASPTSTATVTVAGAYTFRWTITNGTCTSTDDVVVTFGVAPTTSNAGTDQPNVCGLVATLAGNPPATGTGMWSQISGPGTTTFSNASSPTSTATVTVVGAYTFRWTITNGTCTSTDDVVVTYTATPTTSNAGPDQPNVCGLLATLAGNTPSTGTGMWSQFSGPGTTTFSNAASPTSTATVTVQGAYTFRWTITNGPCTSTDDVVVTYTATPTTSNAGPDQPNVCGLVATLAGNTPATGTGMWSQFSGPGTTTFSNASSPTSTATVTVVGAYTFRWTITNGTCTSTDDVVVTYTATPTTSNAGPDQPNVCGLVATLAGNTPATGTGMWSQFSGPGTTTFSNAASPTSTATVTVQGAYTFRWTITNGPCTSTDDVVITYTATPTTSNAGPDQPNVCGLVATLAGNTPATGTGMWSQFSGPGTTTFSNASSPSSTATVTVVGAYTFRWTITNGPCTSTDDVVVTYTATPTTSNAGPDQPNVCGLAATLGGNTPATGTGMWSQFSGPGTTTFSNASSPTSTATVTVVGAYTFRWTITNGTCTSTDDVVVTYTATPTTSNAGPDQPNVCGLVATLAGNTPASGTGMWSQFSGPGTTTFSNAASATSTATVTVQGAYTFRWTITNGPCSSTDDVVVTYTLVTTSNAGVDQGVCGLVATLASNTPAAGTGMWSQVSGPGTVTFSNAASPTSMATASVAGAYTLRWTITNGSCVSTDDVVITYTDTPTTSNAGPDQPNVCGLVATLAGNTPSVGTGMWSQVSGPGTTTFSNAASPTSTATVTVQGAYTFRWTITNGSCTSTDDVVVTYTATPTTSNAGPDQPNVCGLVATLAGNTPTTGTGMWSQVSGPGTTIFSNAASPTSTATVTVAGAYTFRWTITNGSCTSTDDVVVTYTATPTTSNAGPDQPNVCGLVATLAGNTPSSGTGMWSQVSGPGTITFSNAASPTSTATASVTGAYTLRWTITNGSCTSTDDVVITYTATPTTSNAGADQPNVCGLVTTLAGNTPSVGTGMWSQVSGPGTTTFSNAASPTSMATVTVQGAYTFRWTITNGPCTSTDDVVVTYSATVTTSNAGPDQTLCGLQTTLAGNTPSTGTGMWSKVSGPGTITFSNAASPTSMATASVAGTYTLRWTITNGSCNSTDDVAITYTANPTPASTGGNQNICVGGTTNGLGGNNPTVGTGQWSIVSGGTGTFTPNASANNATFTHTGGAGPVVLRWTISNPPCAASTADATITIKQPPTTATVGGDQTIIPGGTTAQLGGNMPASGTGMWSIATAGFTGVFSDPMDPNATWHHLTGTGQVKLRWTISNLPCPDSFAEVTIQIGVAPTIMCPGPITKDADSGQCSASVSFTVTATGTPSPTITCKVGATVITSPHTFPVGSTTVNCTASNGVPPDAPCSFTVTVNDTQPPSITCPPNKTQGTDPGQCSAVVTYNNATATDNCTGVGTPMCSPASGSTFLKGTTTVTCSVKDASKNMSMCTFTVTVNDTQAPTITCPPNKTQNTDPGQCSAVVTYNNATATDNCPGVGMPMCSPASGTAFPKGTTTVTCTVKDSSNNMDSCNFTVTVNDMQPPTITCPDNIFVAASSVTCLSAIGQTVNYTPTATDNCPGVTVVCSPASGSVFPVGTTSVTCTATDASGNSASCSFRVTVFTACLVDQTNSGNVVLFNAQTGDYRFCCNGQLLATGTGTVNNTQIHCEGTIDDTKGARRVHIQYNFTAKTGTAALFLSVSSTAKCTITRGMIGNACTCPSPPATIVVQK